MNYFIDDILQGCGIKVWGQVSASEVSLLKPQAEGVRSYIVMLIPYHTPDTERNIARFACFPDYHAAVKGILAEVCGELKKRYPRESFKASVDSSPIGEVKAAEICGLGVIGKNGLLINEQYGSYCFIAEIATSLELTAPVTKKAKSTCLNCEKCLAVCPFGALSNDGLDATKCISHITQKKGELSEWEAEAVANAEYIWGCDLCQEVCPMNLKVKDTNFRCFMDTDPIVTEDMVNNPEFFKASAFAWRGKETILRNIKLKKQNSEV